MADVSLLPEPSNTHAQMRASDRDRQLVADVLTAAYADGRITRDELDERLSSTWAARTFGDLTPITHDLTGSRAITQYTTPTPVVRSSSAAPDAVAIAPPGAAQSTYTAIMSTINPQSGVALRSRTNVTSVMGEVKLDLRGGSMESNECQLSVQCIMGSLTITVPAGVSVRDEMVKIMAETKMKGLVPEAAGPVLVLTGTVFMGEIKVLGPDRRTVRKALGLDG